MTPKLLMIVLDGARYDKLLNADTPHVKALAETGMLVPSWIHDNALGPTISGNGHASMLTGVWSDKHESWDNDFTAPNFAEYPSIFTRMAAAKPELRTSTAISWEPLSEHIVGEVGTKIVHLGENDRENDIACAEAGKVSIERGDDAVYVYLVQGDHASHSFGVESPMYDDALRHVDSLVGELVETLNTRTRQAEYADEHWLILLATDHGQTRFGHGGDEYTTRLGWVLVAGDAAGDFIGTASETGAGTENNAGTAQAEWKLVDIAATALTHMGIDIDPKWGFDGTPIGSTTVTAPGTFDDIVSGLTPYEPVPGYTFPGSTEAVPAGWIAETDPKHAHGWAFITGHYWSWRMPRHGRGSFVRARGPIAVCDPAMAPLPGAVHATLWSPEFGTEGIPEAPCCVCLHSHYRQTGTDPQEARVVALLSGGEEVTLWSRSAELGELLDISVPERIDIPEGTIRVGFHFEAEKPGGYWAIDAPEFCTARCSTATDAACCTTNPNERQR